MFRDLASSKRLQGRFKDQLKSSLTQANIDHVAWETIPANRPSWCRTIRGRAETFEPIRRYENYLRRVVRRTEIAQTTHYPHSSVILAHDSEQAEASQAPEEEKGIKRKDEHADSRMRASAYYKAIYFHTYTNRHFSVNGLVLVNTLLRYIII